MNQCPVIKSLANHALTCEPLKDWCHKIAGLTRPLHTCHQQSDITMAKLTGPLLIAVQLRIDRCGRDSSDCTTYSAWEGMHIVLWRRELGKEDMSPTCKSTLAQWLGQSLGQEYLTVTVKLMSCMNCAAWVLASSSIIHCIIYHCSIILATDWCPVT